MILLLNKINGRILEKRQKLKKNRIKVLHNNESLKDSNDSNFSGGSIEEIKEKHNDTKLINMLNRK